MWDVDFGAKGEWITTPRHVLVAHTAPVKCVTKATAGQDCHVVVSSSENGEMFVWDTVDGRVIESKRYDFAHDFLCVDLGLVFSCYCNHQ